MPAGGPDLDLLAASIRADASDLRTFLDVLAAKLTEALPGQVTVQREGGVFAREHRVRRLEVALGGRRYALEWAAGAVTATVADGGGVQTLSLDQAVEMLSRDVMAEARASTRARSAMDGLLSGQLPEQIIQRPAEALDQIVFLWPDNPVPALSTLVVAAGEQAVAVQPAGAIGPIPPGRQSLAEAGVLPAPDDPDSVEANIWFVSTREFPGLRFGGMVDKVQDPQTGLAVGLRVFGEYALAVRDPVQVIAALAGAGDHSNARFANLMRDLLLKVLREDVVTHIAAQGWPILGLAAHEADIERETLRGLREAAQGYGLDVPRLGNFTISMKEEDEALLTAHLARRADAAAADAHDQVCGACGAGNGPSARFCQTCGRPLASTCPQCGTVNGSTARFCQSCGTALQGAGPAPAAQ